MDPLKIQSKQFSDIVVRALRERDCALWIGEAVARNTASIPALQQLISLPWKVVLCEYASEGLLKSLDAEDQTSREMHRNRGFMHFIASDPEGMELPPRSLPVLLLNGRPGSSNPGESTQLGGFAKLRRRLNMLQLLVAKRPKLLVVLSDGEAQPLDDLQTLWRDEGFRTLLTVVSKSPSDDLRITKWLTEKGAPGSIEHCQEEVPVAVENLREKLRSILPSSRLFVRMRDSTQQIVERDITDCDLLERPLLDKFELIQARDLKLIQHSELQRSELENFFGKSSSSWLPYAAGLPWPRSRTATPELIKALEAAGRSDGSGAKILSVVSQAGAGGTTFARWLAFAAASEGYPVLIARPNVTEFQPLETSRFLYSVAQLSTEEAIENAGERARPQRDECPWVLVFDVEHWDGRESELRTFVNALHKEGRPVVVVRVCPPTISADLGKNSVNKQLSFLTHEIPLEEALALGRHLNRFLGVHGQQRSDHDWQSFWEAHRPSIIQRKSANFWIALQFWLRGLIDMTQSLQKWIYESFQKADMSDELRLIVLEIAALSVERQPLPEGLIPLSKTSPRPHSILLDDLRIKVPALALVRETVGDQRLWVIGHDLLARYLLSSVMFDRPMLDRLGLNVAEAIGLRLNLLGRVAKHSDLALKPFRRLGIDFAVKILKLDADGNQEFIMHWRQVLEILRSIPPGVRQTSRAFNHHVAVSLRRVAKQKEFGVSAEECRSILNSAVQHLEYALLELDEADADESKLNLFNSLALAYQDLADVEMELQSSNAVIERLRQKASDATRKALEQDPYNPYVLETTAKNLIQHGELYDKEALRCSTEALGYIYQALSLERAENRQIELNRLADRAIKLLRKIGDIDAVRDLAERQNNPLGTLAEAWIVLLDGIDGGASEFSELPSENIERALAILENSRHKSEGLLLRLRYDLRTIAGPADFQSQLELLDELEGTTFRMPLQLKLEHAILLHQQNRHLEGNTKFRALRQELKSTEAIVEVPNRLFWLKSRPDRSKTVLEAEVVETGTLRARARVRELLNEMAPFVPQEFGVQKMRPGVKFKCNINFGRLGPFIKPISG